MKRNAQYDLDVCYVEALISLRNADIKGLGML